jgi:hypothetical protein
VDDDGDDDDEHGQVEEGEYGSDDDLVGSLLNDSSSAAGAGATPLEMHSRKRSTPSTAAPPAASSSGPSSRKKPRGTPAGYDAGGGGGGSAATSGGTAREVIEQLAKKAQCSLPVAVHALLVCSGVPAHAFAYLIGKNDGNLPKDVHVWSCDEDRVMQAVRAEIIVFVSPFAQIAAEKLHLHYDDVFGDRSRAMSQSSRVSLAVWCCSRTARACCVCCACCAVRGAVVWWCAGKPRISRVP